MDAGGLSLAAWTVALEEDFDGWMVVEARGGFNLEVDGTEVTRLRRCGADDPEVSWFRARLARGVHRIRATIASPRGAAIRLSLYGVDGRPGEVELRSGGPGPWAMSELNPELPPATAALIAELSAEGSTVEELLLAAKLAGGRRDILAQRRWLELATTNAPDNAWAQLAFGEHFLFEPTGLDSEEGNRLARDHLRQSVEVPYSLMAERVLAMREQRSVDVERLLDQLVEGYGDDVRVLQLWVREAVRRGWAGEAEEGLTRLHELLPDSIKIIELSLSVFEALDRWEERRALLESLAKREPFQLGWIEHLDSGCLVDEAVMGLERLRSRVDNPDIDVSLVRFSLSVNDQKRARAEVARAKALWGDLEILDHLQVVLEAGSQEGLATAVSRALERDPSNIQLRTLAWRNGARPFFEPYRVDAQEVAKRQPDAESNVDVELLLDQAVERIFPDGSAIYYYHGISRANTPVGARQASTLQQLPDAHLLKLRIIGQDGRVVVPAQMESRNGTVVLGDVGPGDLVEEEYVARIAPTGASRQGHMSPYVYRFADPERAFGLSEYALLLPPELDVQVDGNFEGLNREEREEDGLRIIRWWAEDVPPLRREPFAPPVRELLPWVSYSFGVSWQDVGDIMRDRVLAMLRSSRELREWSGELLGHEDPIVALRRLVDAVSDEVEPGRSALSLGTSAGESFSRGRGNRLGIVAAALVDAGWEVDLVMARARPFAGTHLEVPTLETFTEPLLRVRRDGREIWLDLEERRRAVDHIRPILQGSDALVLPLSRPSDEVTILDETPEFDNPELEERIHVVAELDPSGDAQLSLEMLLSGPEAERVLERISSVPGERVDMVYLQMAGNMFPGASEVRGEVERQEEGALIRLEMKIPAACDLVADSMVCRSLTLGRPLVPGLASLPERQFPLVVQLPIEERIELEIQPPAGWIFEKQPRRLVARWGSIEESLELGEGGIRSVLKMAVPAQTVAPGEYPEFARFCHAVDELTSRPPTFRRSGGQ
jgi:hypothetical protein